jgi:hypothetical protein
MAHPNRMSLRPGLLWLTLNPALIIQCFENILFLDFTYPVRCFPYSLKCLLYPRLDSVGSLPSHNAVGLRGLLQE